MTITQQKKDNKKGKKSLLWVSILLILASLLCHSAEAKHPMAKCSFSESPAKLHKVLFPTIGVNEVLQIVISTLIISTRIGIEATTTGQDEPMFLAILSSSLIAIAIIIGGGIGILNSGIAGWAIGILTAIVGTKVGMIANAIRRGQHPPQTQNIFLDGVLAGICFSGITTICCIPVIALFLHIKKRFQQPTKRGKSTPGNE